MATSARIFSVDDDPIIALELDIYLNRLGYESCGRASTGEAALCGVRENDPDLILLDIGLPGSIDGVQTAELIREHKKSIPIVFLTTYSDDETLRRALKAEPFGYLLKPINERELHTCIQAALHKNQADKRLSQAKKLETVIRLTGGFAHHFNNQLAVVIGNLEIAMSSLRPKQTGLEDLRRALDASMNSAELVRKLVAAAGKRPCEATAFDVNQELCTLLDAIQCGPGEATDIRTNLTRAPLPVHLDLQGFDGAVMALVDNACNASREGVSVSTHLLKHEEGDDNSGPELERGLYALVQIQDRGKGIGSELLEKVLEPFFTTKEIGQATGLGLSIALGFAKQSGGDLTISSDVGEGTSVRLYLPIHEHDPRDSRPLASAEPPCPS
jgi:signal transduction histidine kinase